MDQNTIGTRWFDPESVFENDVLLKPKAVKISSSLNKLNSIVQSDLAIQLIIKPLLYGKASN